MLSNCTTVDLVEKFAEGAEYSRLPVRATAVAAFGTVRAHAEGSREAALLATALAEDRRASIVSVISE